MRKSSIGLIIVGAAGVAATKVIFAQNKKYYDYENGETSLVLLYTGCGLAILGGAISLAVSPDSGKLYAAAIIFSIAAIVLIAAALFIRTPHIDYNDWPDILANWGMLLIVAMCFTSIYEVYSVYYSILPSPPSGGDVIFSQPMSVPEVEANNGDDGEGFSLFSLPPNLQTPKNNSPAMLSTAPETDKQAKPAEQLKKQEADLDKFEKTVEQLKKQEAEQDKFEKAAEQLKKQADLDKFEKAASDEDELMLESMLIDELLPKCSEDGDLERDVATTKRFSKLRREPSLDNGNVISFLPKGTEVEVLSTEICTRPKKTNLRFAKVHHNHITGFINLASLQFRDDFQKIAPLSTPLPTPFYAHLKPNSRIVTPNDVDGRPFSPSDEFLVLTWNVGQESALIRFTDENNFKQFGTVKIHDIDMKRANPFEVFTPFRTQIEAGTTVYYGTGNEANVKRGQNILITGWDVPFTDGTRWAQGIMKVSVPELPDGVETTVFVDLTKINLDRGEVKQDSLLPEAPKTDEHKRIEELAKANKPFRTTTRRDVEVAHYSETDADGFPITLEIGANTPVLVKRMTTGTATLEVDGKGEVALGDLSALNLEEDQIEWAVSEDNWGQKFATAAKATLSAIGKEKSDESASTIDQVSGRLKNFWEELKK